MSWSSGLIKQLGKGRKCLFVHAHYPLRMTYCVPLSDFILVASDRTLAIVLEASVHRCGSEQIG